MDRDRRIAEIAASIDVEVALQAGGPLRTVMEILRQQADQAMEDFAAVNPGDVQAVTGIQARVACFSLTLKTLNFILQRGQVAEMSLRAEDGVDGRDD